MDVVLAARAPQPEPGGGVAGDRAGRSRAAAAHALPAGPRSLRAGRVRRRRRRIDAFAALARELHAPWYLWRAALLRAMRALIHGRFAEAEALAAEAEGVGRRPATSRSSAAWACTARGSCAPRSGTPRCWPRPRCRGSTGSGSACWATPGSWTGTALACSRLEDAEGTRRHLARIPPQFLPHRRQRLRPVLRAEPVAFVGTPRTPCASTTCCCPPADRDVMLGMTQVLWEGPVARVLGAAGGAAARWVGGRGPLRGRPRARAGAWTRGPTWRARATNTAGRCWPAARRAIPSGRRSCWPTRVRGPRRWG